MLHVNGTVGLVEPPLSSEILGPATLGAAWPDRRISEQNLLLAGAYNSGEDDDSEDEDEDEDEEKGDGKHPKPPAPPPEPKPPAPPPEPTPPSPQPEPTPPSPKPDPTPPAPRPVPNVPGQPDFRSGSRGGSWSGVKTLDNPFEAYFENNVSGQNLAKIVVYFGLQDSFAAIQDDGHVDIVWLKFERKPSLKGINVVIDGTKRKPDFSATTGSLALLIFFDQATLTRRSDVFAAYGTVDVATAGKATHRPLR